MRVSPKRTTIVMELAGDGVVSSRDRVVMTAADARVDGEVVRVLSDGRAMIRLDGELPEAARPGAELAVAQVHASRDEPCQLSLGQSPSSAVLRPGGTFKPYWDVASIVTPYRTADPVADVEYSLAVGEGDRRAVGGDANESTEYEVQSLTHAVRATVGREFRPGLAAGVDLRASTEDRKGEADVSVRGTSETTRDTHWDEETHLTAAPHLTWISRPATFEIGFGGGVSWHYESESLEASVDGANAGEHESSVRRSGPTFEIGSVAYDWALMLQAASLNASGDTTELGISPHRSELGVLAETYSAAVKTRLQLAMIRTGEDMGQSSASGYRANVRLSFGRSRWQLVPFAEYETVRETTVEGQPETSSFEVGSRLVLAGALAPFVALSLGGRAEDASGEGGAAETEENLRTIKIAMGMVL